MLLSELINYFQKKLMFQKLKWLELQMLRTTRKSQLLNKNTIKINLQNFKNMATDFGWGSWPPSLLD